MATILINATNNTNRVISSPLQPLLVQHMYSQRTLFPFSRLQREGWSLGAEIHMPSMLVVGLTKVYMVNMYLWGPSLFTSSAFLMGSYVSRALIHMFQNESESF
jgi:hypothetical protein